MTARWRSGTRRTLPRIARAIDAATAAAEVLSDATGAINIANGAGLADATVARR